jgi:hypothetical protein
MRTDAVPGLDRCEIVWWSGYVKGRFQAYATSASRPPVLIGESPAFRSRSGQPPAPTDAAVAALAVLTDRLEQAGWIDQGGDNGTWFALVLRHHALGVTPSSARDSNAGAVARLRHELEHALEVVDRERQLRLEAESESRQRAARAALADVGPSARPFVVLGYILAIVYAAAIFLFGFHSLYAAVVASLTAAAVSLGVDCWLITRRRTSTAGGRLTGVRATDV